MFPLALGTWLGFFIGWVVIYPGFPTVSLCIALGCTLAALIDLWR